MICIIANVESGKCLSGGNTQCFLPLMICRIWQISSEVMFIYGSVKIANEYSRIRQISSYGSQESIRGCPHITSAAGGGEGGRQMLTIADGGGGGGKPNADEC